MTLIVDDGGRYEEKDNICIHNCSSVANGVKVVAKEAVVVALVEVAVQTTLKFGTDGIVGHVDGGVREGLN